jgi:hypothetical protein
MGIYEQLNTQTAGNVTKTDYDRVSNPIHIERANKEALKDRVDVGLASNMLSTAGPIPGTGKVVLVSRTSSGDEIFFTPDPGQVWRVEGVCTGGTVNGTMVLKLKDLTNDIEVEIGQETAANTVFHPYWGPSYIDDNLVLMMHFSGVSSTCETQAAFIRVR